jgi:hypothetical protein
VLGEIIDQQPIVVDIDTIALTAFVLPCVENMTDNFPLDIDKATYFLVIPPRWIGITLGGMITHH